MSRLSAPIAFAVTLVIAACSAPGPDDLVSSDRTPPGSTGRAPVLIGVDTATDPTVRRLEREAIALARTDGCTSVQQCASAPVGSRGCGGPRFYLPYCPLTTDTAALLAKLAEVAKAEDDYNRRNRVVSTCEMRMPGDLELSGGACGFKPVR